MQHNQNSYTPIFKSIRIHYGPGWLRDGEENYHSAFLVPESDSSVLKTVMFSVYTVHSQGQIGSLQLRIGHIPFTKSLIEMCQAMWTLFRTDGRKKDMTMTIGPTYFMQSSFKRSPERG